MDLMNRLNDVVATSLPEGDWEAWLLNLGAALLATLVLLAATRIVRRLDRVVVEKIAATTGSFKVQSLELMSGPSLQAGLRTAWMLTRRFVLLCLWLLYINFALRFFPSTRRWSEAFFEELLQSAWSLALAVTNYLPNLLSIALILLLTFAILSLAKRVFYALHTEHIRFEGFYPDWAMPTYQLLRVLLLALSAVAVFPYLPGSGSPAFQGVSIFLGVLLSLGSTSAVAHLVAGVVLIYMRPFAVGDRVKIADTLGDVLEKSLLSVRLRTPYNVEVVLPNASVLSGKIENYSSAAKQGRLLLTASATLGYDVDHRVVRDLFLEAARQTKEICATPAPVVRQTALNDFHIGYELNCATQNARDMWNIESDLRANVLDVFAAAGVEIMSPGYTAIRDGNASTARKQQNSKHPS